MQKLHTVPSLILALNLAFFCSYCHSVLAETLEDIAYKLNFSVVKVQVSNEKGDRGIGSGVVVSQNQVVTNCHVVANSRGIAITKNGESYQPVAMKADWHHDLCILKFQGLPIASVPLAEDNSALNYEQNVFSIGYPNNPIKPLTAFGKIKALYTLEGAQVIRTSAAFRMGASGGALFDEAGKLIGINTFKSPGRKSYYYSLPVVWVKRLLDGPEVSITTQRELPFWDAPQDKQPFFMQVVDAQLSKNWAMLRQVATAWLNADPNSPEAWYYQGVAADNQGKNDEAIAAYKKAVVLNPRHTSAFYDWGLVALRVGNQAEVERIATALASIDREVADDFKLAISQPGK